MYAADVSEGISKFINSKRDASKYASRKSISDPSLKTHEKLAILLGTEGDGLASDTIAETDATVLIPMTHGVDSLNVAAASAVAFWELAGRR